MPALTQGVSAELQQLCAARRWYEFLVRAHQELDARPAVPELAHATLRVLVELGLGGPALELLQLRRDLGLTRAEKTAQCSLLAALPAGRLTWPELESTFRRNLAALASCRPAWHDAEPRLRAALAHLHLHRSRAGQFLLSRREPGKLRQWLADLSAAGIAHNGHTERRTTSVIGARLGPLLPQVYQQSRHVQMWYSQPLYLVETDLACFAAWLHCADHSAWLGDPRVHVLVGPDAVAQSAALWRHNPRLVLPTRLVNLTADEHTASELQAAIRRAADEDQAQIARLTCALEARYRECDAVYWTSRFHPPGPILGITSRFTTMLQYSMRDALAAFAAQGYRTEMLIEGSDHELLRPRDVLQAIYDLDPLLVLALDHARSEVPYLPRNLPYLLWVQDPLPDLLCRQAGASVAPLDLVCGYYQARCTQELGYPPEQFVSVVVPVSTRVFHDGALDAGAAARYAADICYVGHGGQPLDAQHEAVARRNPALRSRLAVVYDRVRRVLRDAESVSPTATIDELVRSVATVDGIGLNEFAYRLLDAGRRQQTLEWVAAWARQTGRVFKIYGRGWDEHPALREFAAGVIAHGEPLRQAYRAAKLSLQLMPSGYLHQRAFEALASGCLPLTRYTPADFAGRSVNAFVAERPRGRLATSNAVVLPRLERVVFRSAEEFAALAEQYLADGAGRAQVITELRAVVLRDFTYTAVMGRVMAALQTHLARGQQTPVPEAWHKAARNGGPTRGGRATASAGRGSPTGPTGSRPLRSPRTRRWPATPCR
jgi:hypothetical protein